MQWYQEVSHVLSLFLFAFFEIPVETDGQLSPPPLSVSTASEGDIDGSLLGTMNVSLFLMTL